MSGWSKTFILLSGILYAFVGVYCFFQPIGALIGLAWSIGFLVLTSGIFGVIAYIQIPKEERVIWGLLVCLTDIIFGMLVLTFNGTMILSALLPLFFAVTFIIRGIFTLIHSRDFDALITHKCCSASSASCKSCLVPLFLHFRRPPRLRWFISLA